MRLQLTLTLLCTLLSQFGCTSISSTMLTRDEQNLSWTRKGPLKGVPITLKVPTHVNLTIFERHFLLKGKDGVRRLSFPFVVRDFSQEFIYGEKIFTVDFKRPAAGLYNLHLDLSEDQYIDELQYDITDQTIKEVTAFVKQIAPTGIDPAVASDPPSKQGVAFDEVQSVVAVAMFDIDDPMFEENMCDFINSHLNQYHDAGPNGLVDAPLDLARHVNPSSRTNQASRLLNETGDRSRRSAARISDDLAAPGHRTPISTTQPFKR